MLFIIMGLNRLWRIEAVRLMIWMLLLALCFLAANSLIAAQETRVKANNCQRQTEMRAAIDFGSGAIKMQVGRVDIKAGRIVDKPLIEKHLSLNLTEDVAMHGGRISEEMQRKALAILQQLKKEALVRDGKVKFAGIATAVFRKAENGTEILQLFEKQLGLRFHVLTQEEEGKLGLMTAKALYPEVDENKLIAWDSGNGSFQLSVKGQEGFRTYQGPLGYGTVRVILSKEIRNGPVFLPHESGNPVTMEEAKMLETKVCALVPEAPEWLKAALKSKNAVVVTFGDGKSLFPVIAESLAAMEGRSEPVETITQTDLKKMCAFFLEQEDTLFDSMGIYNRTSSASVFLLAVMEKLGIESFHFRKAVGNTSGMLISPRYW